MVHHFRHVAPIVAALLFGLCLGLSRGAHGRPRTLHEIAPAPSASVEGGSVPDAASMIMGAEGPAAPKHPTLIRHTLEGQTDCLACHGATAIDPYPDNHANRSPASCLHCHVPSPSGSGLELATNGYCFGCHGNRALDMHLEAGGPALSLFVDAEVFGRSVHGRAHTPCIACHLDIGRYPHPRLEPPSRRALSRSIAQQGCGSCHDTIFSQYKKSVHGQALVEDGNLDVPGCPDCHGIHDIGNPHTAVFRMGSPDTCSKCHADRALTAKYGMSPDVTRTYLRDFHGTTVRLTRTQGAALMSNKPVCYDCHGIHDIKKVDDPDSRVVKDRLVETCRRCHAGATTSFPSAWLKHYEPNRGRWPLVYWVNVAYKILIPAIIGPMIVYILLDLSRALLTRLRTRRPA